MPLRWANRRQDGRAAFHLGAISCLILVVALAGCAGYIDHARGASATSTTLPPQATVVYSNGASAAHPGRVSLVDFRVNAPQANAILANLGVFPYQTCGGWGWGNGIPWNPPAGGLGSHLDSALHEHANSVWVYAPATSQAPNAFDGGQEGDTPAGLGSAAPPNWIALLATEPTVDFIENGNFTPNCPMIPVDLTPIPGRAYFLASAGMQAPSYLRVTFGSGIAYNDAVLIAVSQGLRLANPCAEGTPAAWAPLSQAATYASSHTLTLALTIASSTLWRQQLDALSGVSSVLAPYTLTC